MLTPTDRGSTAAALPTTDHVLTHPEGSVRIRSSSRWHVAAQLHPGRTGGPVMEWVTAYPPALVALVLAVKGPGWVCDELMRSEDPSYVAASLGALRAYLAPEAMRGKRILDFGCGAGASSVVLAQMYPDAEAILAMDFQRDFLRIARALRDHHGARRVEILEQPDPRTLPRTGPVDLAVLSAVVEHMLPDERRAVLPQVWDRVTVGGVVFVCDTPHRWFPKEAHTTNLWGLNYQSDRAAHRRTLALGMTDLGGTWPAMLRAGIRGSTEREIVACLTRGRPEDAAILRPLTGSRADLWHRALTPGRKRVRKRAAQWALAAMHALTGTLFTQNITLAVRRVR